MQKQKIAVLYGGRSAEHEISVISALQAMQTIDSRRCEVLPVYLALNGKWYTGDVLFSKEFYKRIPQSYLEAEEITLMPDSSIQGFIKISSQNKIPVDVCLMAFHGQYGEDGCVQGLLELADLPYTGCGVAASAVAMNKFQSKAIVKAHGISTLPCVLVNKEKAILSLSSERNRIFQILKYPLFIKPNHLGSSIGISIAHNEDELNRALAKVFQYDDQALVEPYLERLLEINVAIIDDDPPRASVVEIPMAKEGALTYEDKYLRGETKAGGSQHGGMASLSRLVDPPHLQPNIKQNVIVQALQAFQLLDCSGICRFDFMHDLQSNITYFNEVNPIPGSFAFYLWEKSSPRFLFTELIEKLITRAKEKKSLQRSLKRDFGFHALLQ